MAMASGKELLKEPPEISECEKKGRASDEFRAKQGSY